MRKTLTADDVKALKGADESIVFRYTSGDDGDSVIEVSKRISPHGGYGDGTVDRTIPVTTAKLTAYRYNDDSDAPSDGVIVNACWVFLSVKFHRPLQTFIQQVKVGDEIRFEFVANNNSKTLQDSGLAADEVNVEIIRGEPGPKQKRMEFALGYSIVPRYGLARNIRFETV